MAAGSTFVVVSIASFLRKARLSVVVHWYCKKDKNFCVHVHLGCYWDMSVLKPCSVLLSPNRESKRHIWAMSGGD